MEPCEKHEMWGCDFCTPTGEVRVHDKGREGHSGSPWTAKEELVAADPALSDQEVSEITGRTAAAVHTHRMERGYTKPTRRRTRPDTTRGKKYWTPTEEGYLKAHAADSNEDVAKALGRSVKAVAHRRTLGLSKGQNHHA